MKTGPVLHLDRDEVPDFVDRDEVLRLEAASSGAGSESRYRVLSIKEIGKLPTMQWCVKHVLPAYGMAAIYGPSGSGKSFLALDLAAAIALGAPWFGHRTYGNPVIYVMLEGEGAIRNRMTALEMAKGPLPAGKFGVVAQPFVFAEEKDINDLIKVIPPGAVVFVDTLNRAAPTTEENSSKEMGAILQAAKKLQAAIKGLVVMIHHTGKDAARGPRGHSSLLAALDAAIEVERDTKGTRTWNVAKAKDDEEGKQTAFKLVSHVIGQDVDSEDITSCSVVPDDSHNLAKPDPQGKNQKLALKTLREKFDSGNLPTKELDVCPTGVPCMKIQDAEAQITQILTIIPYRRRSVEARRLVSSLVQLGHLEKARDSAGDEWCWLG